MDGQWADGDSTAVETCGCSRKTRWLWCLVGSGIEPTGLRVTSFRSAQALHPPSGHDENFVSMTIEENEE